ncbi:hypothetical protein KL930_000848 [Ogataea haglerorum]|uniref:Zn(2)-C6 fungal-type domain-containing protein n=1 Tax=Ogataea haglerorum TaxID=1937702 RepID=A0AAN6DA01_9ASCO|nr:uncharacterized protein KL911_003531 [Ogataea haglerorum]KAG7700161.1 hypothetical protein KL915_000850 [Ogataea haglerorum]KAG7701818.1 hypothetical protein KL951_000274 [Ogataea haglerorum]KAG7711632.1 hypothetical protein KL914_000274 [Ogataea haglerorum]KAG7712403.1 hypothetical protein KL950_000274 [Ogataea haglerorum]KAG7722455.1 hypothetical protein KL913_000275 [Ogataea haglerorum]
MKEESPDESRVPKRPGAKRKFHKKSRKGCATCKKRRVKCDETRPVCGNCDRMGIQCVYTIPATVQPTQALTTDQVANTSGPLPMREQKPNPLQPPEVVQEPNLCPNMITQPPPTQTLAYDTHQTLNMLDLRLMYHYTTKVWPTITEAGISDSKIWSEEIPMLAFKYPARNVAREH